MTPCLIISDLDNTLLTPEHDLSPFTLSTLRTLAQQGHHIALASGRHHFDLQVYAKELAVEVYRISTNGAHLYLPNGQPLAERLMPGRTVSAVTSVGVPEDVSISLYTRDGWLINRDDSPLANMHSGTGFQYEKRAEVVGYDGDDVGKVLFSGHPLSLAQVEQRINALEGHTLHLTYSGDQYLEIMAEGVNKGTALAQLLDHLALDASAVYAFGDNLNDIEMLQHAGNPHVVANARAEVFEQLPHAMRIGHHAEDAVAHRLHQHFLLS